MSEELKPCAYCGSADVEVRQSITDALVACNNCGCRTGFVYFGADDAANAAKIREAVAIWNTRTPPPSQHREPIEADREAADRFCNPIDNPHLHRLLVKAFTAHRLAFSTPAAAQELGLTERALSLLDRAGKCIVDSDVWASIHAEASAIRDAISTPAASDAEAMARALKAAHEALSRANVTAYLDMPEDTADVVARAVIAALLLPKAGEMETETVFEVWEDDLMVASASTEAEGLHYFAVYSQDGPVKLVRAETVRQVITTPSTEGRKGEDQADG